LEYGDDIGNRHDEFGGTCGGKRSYDKDRGLGSVVVVEQSGLLRSCERGIVSDERFGNVYRQYSRRDGRYWCDRRDRRDGRDGCDGCSRY
jgi:hypothetical protein